MTTNGNDDIERKKVEKLAELFYSPYSEAHKVAAWAIATIGESAVPLALEAIPNSNYEMTKNSGLLGEIAWALDVIGEDAIPHLKATVKGDNPVAGKFAMQMLEDFGFEDADFLSESLAVSEFKQRVEEIQGKDHRYIQTELKDFIDLQIELIEALGEIGDEKAITKLFDLSKSFMEDRELYQYRRNIIKATKSAIETYPDEATHHVIGLFKDLNSDTSGDMKEFIHGLLPILSSSSTPEAKEFLLGMLSDESQEQLHKNVMNAIRLGTEPEPILIELISHPQKSIQQLAADALSILKKTQ